MKRLPLTHLLLIIAALAILAAIAWFYTNANESVDGIPPVGTSAEQPVPTSKDACETAGGVWNPCASACPPGAEACIQMCVQKCEFPSSNDGGGDLPPVYFLNSKLDPAVTCEKVFPVERGESSDVDTSMEALLAGPTTDERARGYETAIPVGVKLLDITSRGKITRLSFDAKLDQGVAGSCRTNAIRAQIETTVRAAGYVPEGNTIEIIAGEKSPAETLQP